MLHTLRMYSITISDLLKYHVVSGAYYSKGLTSGQVTAINGEALNITVSTGNICCFFFFLYNHCF